MTAAERTGAHGDDIAAVAHLVLQRDERGLGRDAHLAPHARLYLGQLQIDNKIVVGRWRLAHPEPLAVRQHLDPLHLWRVFHEVQVLRVHSARHAGHDVAIVLLFAAPRVPPRLHSRLEPVRLESVGVLQIEVGD